jgi:tripartite-type tricarboxylate transporter receptor subunit TctC
MKPQHWIGIAACVAGALVIASGVPLAAQAWPTRQILVVSPFYSGTTYDLVARLVLDQAAREIGQPFVLENRPGDDGAAGIMSVVKAAPDGYTLLLSSSAMSAAVILHKSLPYDAKRDLAPVAMFGGQPGMLVAAPGKGYSSVDDLVAAAKANPGKLKFASVGIGSASHLAGERFRLVAGLNVQHVAYPGPAEAFNDLTAGRVDFYFVPIPAALPLAVQGKVVPLAVSTISPWPSLDALPTLAESGYTIATFMIWCGLAAPAQTPRDVVAKLNNAIGDALALPAIRDRLLRIGFKPMQMDPDQYGGFVADDIAATIKLGKNAHIEPTD